MLSRLALLSLATASALAAPEGHLKPPKGFVTTDGANFELDGKPYHFAGTNAYWFNFLTNLTDTSISMDQAKAAGLEVVRTWAFRELNATYNPQGLPQYGGEGAGPSDIWYQKWDNGVPTINYGDNGFKHFDKVVQLAEKKGIKLVLTLTNNWADYGGMDVYTVNLGGQYHDDFYTVPKIKAAFKNYVKIIVNRYKDSPAVFSWQLGNEPRCGADGTRNLPRSPTCSPAILTAWVKEMSAYIKSIDPHHMVSVGDEGMFNRAGNPDGFYNGWDGVDFESFLAIKTVDYGTHHLYPDWWSKDVPWGTQWIKDHAAVQRAANKPVVLEEYGWLTDAARLQYLNKVSNITRLQAVGEWQTTVVQEGLAADMFWQLGITNLSGGNSSDDGFTIYLANKDQSKPLVADHVKAMNALNHRH